MATDAEFAEFWTAYPRKIGKLAARRQFDRARTQATLAELIAGIAAYVRYKPDYADFCHPATWLSQGRWLDEYDAPITRPVSTESPCRHDPPCASRSWHRVVLARERGEVA